MIVGDRLKELREAAGFSQIDIAEHMGWSSTWLSKIENGSVTLPPNEIHRLALAIDDLKCQRDELYKTKQFELLGCASVPVTDHGEMPKEAA